MAGFSQVDVARAPAAGHQRIRQAAHRRLQTISGSERRSSEARKMTSYGNDERQPCRGWLVITFRQMSLLTGARNPDFWEDRMTSFKPTRRTLIKTGTAAAAFATIGPAFLRQAAAQD